MAVCLGGGGYPQFHQIPKKLSANWSGSIPLAEKFRQTVFDRLPLCHIHFWKTKRQKTKRHQSKRHKTKRHKTKRQKKKTKNQKIKKQTKNKKKDKKQKNDEVSLKKKPFFSRLKNDSQIYILKWSYWPKILASGIKSILINTLFSSFYHSTWTILIAVATPVPDSQHKQTNTFCRVGKPL